MHLFDILTLGLCLLGLGLSPGVYCDNHENSWDMCTNNPERGDCTDWVVRWFYNETSAQCDRFWYGGCGGNGNNFENQNNCTSTCGSSKKGTENIVITEDDSKTNEKPTKTTTSTEACSHPSSQGTCRDFVVKWFYNTSSELCERFWYGGCGGNGNRFEQEAECKQACISSEDVCKQPSVTGRCRARHLRWYYNSGRRECMQFIYGGCNGNGNRFRTRIDCERQCLDATEALGDQNSDCRTSRFGCCPDGKTPSGGNNNEGCGPTPCDRTEFGCCDDEVTAAQGPDQEGCEMIEFPSGDGNLCNDTEYGCCPDGITAAQGPSNAGCQVKTPDVSVPDPDVGFTVDSGEAPAHCQLAKNAGPCSDYTVMWYYNARSGNCERFWFGGCEGNSNRFKSEKECLAMCQRNVRREPELPVCEQPKEIGPCRAALRRWYYNRDSGACELFMYSGCQGNENNFDDQETCERRCGVVRVVEISLTAAQICAQPRDVGPCKAAIQKFYYNADTRRCEQFTYGGCGGNRNNFDTEVRCRQYCRASPPVTTVTEAPETRKRQPVCELTPALGPCKRMITKYFYNISSSQCEPFTYGGCLGNHNNFETVEKCSSYCGLRLSRSRTDDCSMSKQAGPCRGNFRRYYYDASIGRCLEFSYGGCQGNGNNFMDEDSCMSTCHDGRIVEPLTRPPIVRPTRAPITRETDICSLRLVTPCENRGEGPFWYYNQNAGECQEIPNGECNKNQNNFRSREACEGYCSRSRVCAPLTYQSDIRCLAYMEHWTYNADTNACEMFVYGGCGGSANNFNTEAACNRKCRIETVEPVTKAPEPTSPEEICAMPEDSGNCLAYIRNWRYDSLTGKCVQFVYGGCGGNENRFQSEQECERYCNRQVVCQKFEDPEISCLAYMRRWRYDPDSGNCENFIYGGCGGNANNFDSLEACDQKCSVAEPDPEPTKETNAGRYSWRDICRLQADVGPCKQFNTRWHYNSITQSCEEFTYGGCLGNHNNFESEIQCMTYCDSSRWARPRPTRPPTTEKPDEVIDESSGEIASVEPATGVDACALDSYTGRCRAYIRSWYYESLTGQCKQFIYGGCDSNGNLFDSQEACDTQCSPRAVCMLPKQSGACMAYITRYYFDYDAQTCREFVYGGCDGNANNFESMEACENRCATLMRDRVPDTRKFGTCPAMRSPRRGEVCIDQCRRDRDCPGRKKCCSLACSYVCVEPEYRRIRPVGKTGYCPPKSDWGGLLGACAPQCSDDSSCQGNQKCCHQGCGMKCTDPVDDEPYQLNTPVRVSARTISSDSISVLWYDRALGPEQEPRDNQYYTIRYYSYGLGQYEYMNVTDLSAVVTGLRPDTEYEFNVRVNSPPYLSQWSENTRNRTTSVAPVERIGYCPPKTDWGGLLGACAPQCRDDSSCLGNQKCCHHGCGMKCVDSVDEEPYQMNAPVRVVANTISTDSILVSWYDRSLAGDQKIRDNRYYTIRYYSFGLGQYEYYNVTELSGYVSGLRSDTEYEFNVRVNDPPYLSEWSENTRNRTLPRVVSKTGQCPVVPSDTFGICVEECQNDADCNGAQKCCSNGCGQTCVNPAGYDICSLQKDPGSCSDWEVRWYYDADNERCDRFWYGGCDEGNANNFMDQAECQSACSRTAPTTARPRPYDCRRTTFGCCLDRYTPRLDEKGSNCAEYEGENTNRGETLVPAIPGESVTLDCSYGGDVTWYRNGKLVEADSRRTLNPDGTMVVTETNIEDDGLYACHVRVNGGRPTVYSYMLQVRVPIGILPGPDKIMVKPNRQAFLHCEVYGNPKPSVSWSKGSQPLSSEYRYETFRNGTLLIRSASEQDIDSYTCTADNGVNSPVERTIKLELREMLVARIENDNGRVMEGARIKLTCEGRGYPPPTITWEKMGRPLSTGGNVFISSDGQLTIRNVTTRDTGTYTCIVSNTEEKIETATSVQVVPKVMPDDKCADKTSLMKCRLIVTARLCGYPMYSKICCASCRRYLRGE